MFGWTLIVAVEVTMKYRISSLAVLTLLILLGCDRVDAIAGEQKQLQSPPVVLSAKFGVCIGAPIGLIVNFDSAGDFTPGGVRLGHGSTFRRIDYGVGARFDQDMDFKLSPNMRELSYRVYFADDQKNHVTLIKVSGLTAVPEVEARFSYPIGDKLSAEYADVIVRHLLECEVVRKSRP